MGWKCILGDRSSLEKISPVYDVLWPCRRAVLLLCICVAVCALFLVFCADDAAGGVTGFVCVDAGRGGVC